MPNNDIFGPVLTKGMSDLISGANRALAAGDTPLAQNYAMQYYALQTGFRSYATDAIGVVNNAGLFGGNCSAGQTGAGAFG